MFYFHIIYLKSTGAGIASCIFIFLIHWYWPSISPWTSRVYLLACSYWRLNTLCRKLNLSPPSLKMRVFLSICFNSNTAFSNLLIVLSLISSCGIINWAYSLKICGIQTNIRKQSTKYSLSTSSRTSSWHYFLHILSRIKVRCRFLDLR